MNRYKENKMSMYLAYLKWYEIHETEVSDIPMFKSIALAIKALVAKIGDLRVLQEANITGTAKEKRETRELLEKAVMKIVVRLTAFAAHNNLSELEEMINFSMSSFKIIADTVFRDRCELVYQKGTQNLAVMVDYGLTQLMLDELKGLNAKYFDLIPMPRLRITERKAKKEEMDILFREVDKKMLMSDKTIAIIRYDDEALYASYTAARLMIDLKGKSKSPEIKTGMEGVVTDFDTELPITGAEVKADTGKAVVITDDEGYYKIALPAGQTQIHVSYPGFTTLTETVEIEDGILFENDIELEKPEESPA